MIQNVDELFPLDVAWIERSSGTLNETTTTRGPGFHGVCKSVMCLHAFDSTEWLWMALSYDVSAVTNQQPALPTLILNI